MRRFDSSGSPIDSNEFQVNVLTMSKQRPPSVSFAPSGGFIVAWGSDLLDGSSYGIFARRFDSSGSPLDPGEIQVNAFTTSDQRRPSVSFAPSGDGDFVVAWNSIGQDGDYRGIVARRFDSSGSPLDPEDFQVNTCTTSRQYSPTVSSSASGDFIVAWVSDGQDGSLGGIFAQRGCSDTDDDGDGVGNACDVCPSVSDLAQADGDGDGAGNACDNCLDVYNPAQGDLDSDGLGNACDVIITSPASGDTLDCSDPGNPLTRPNIAWDDGNYDRFKVFLGSDSSFIKGTRVSSGDKWLRSSPWTPSRKKWKKACKKAKTGDMINPVMYIRILAEDLGLAKNDPDRTTFSQVAQVDIQP